MKVAASVVAARRKSLAALLENHRYLPLAEVCSRLKISEATARRDLRVLEGERRVTRTYGGALSSFDATYASFADRRLLNRQAKARIADKALRFIRPGSTCFFDSGTTVFALAEALYRKPVARLRAVTNNLPVAEMLGRCPAIEVHLLGGRFLQRQSILLGKGACDSARQWKFDLAFLGAERIGADGIFASDAEVAAFQRALLEHAARVVVCAHAAKLERKSGILLAPWSSQIQLVTDAAPAQLDRCGIPRASRSA
ncbi:MAG TPA: DeoR/GlpR family DNA-binding transcription regulator [Candidatus Methylacidiphilales bacterium]|jgi:DeoR/GlpR family transcriptional regulator of sugar metabolism|nr:DeoR/GlpR family DNA-binding transcription regulator [Candidatus Methylacidiphilales bacterium]